MRDAGEREGEGLVTARDVIDVARRNPVTPLGPVCPLLFWIHVADAVSDSLV